MTEKKSKSKIFESYPYPFKKLGFGAMGLSGIFEDRNDEYMIRSVLYSLERGINFIDTARAYSRSEELLGRALKMWKGERPFIATKAAPLTPQTKKPSGVWGWHHPVSVESAYPKSSIRKSLEESLTHLQVDYVDLLQLHNYWGHWHPSEYWLDELDQLKQEGKCLNIGVSVPDHRHDLAIALVRSGRIDSVQTIFNIFDPLALDSLMPVCKENNVAVIARAILDEGGLAGLLSMQTKFSNEDWLYNYFDCLPREIYLQKLDAIKQFIPEHADNLAQLAIKFALLPDEISIALTSMHRHDYAKENIDLLEKPKLSHDVFDTLRYGHRWTRNFYQKRKYL